MNRTIKAIASAFCAVSILMCGTAVYADEGKYTPSGTAYGDIGSTIEKWAADNPDEYVSFAAAVFDKDGIIYENGFGFADRENNIAADADTVYEWGSVTKLTVWVSVMQLYEQGKIDLDADIRT